MCGIAGIYRFDNRNIFPEELKVITDSIAHRGPDGEGYWTSPSISLGLGHRRLSIIDLSDKASQPMHYADGRYTIVFNGEIYNYIEIKNHLLLKGYKFSSSSDTEVLLALYDLKKENCLHDLDGMFAFALWDEKEKKLFCARDRFGEKPFYYYTDNTQFVFCSEMKGLWKHGINREVRSEALFYYLSYDRLLDPANAASTFFKDIYQLPAGCYFYVSENRKMPDVNYWNLNSIEVNNNISLEDAAAKFKNIFKESVRTRLRSDVPVGSSLSGGLDSSTIVLLIDQLKGKEQAQHTFSARFKKFEKDEGKYIDEVIKRSNIDPHFCWPDADGFIKDIDKLCYHQEEPFGSASIFAQWEVMKLAKENNVTVLLDGQGADETLGGYIFYYTTYLNYLHKVSSPIFNEELRYYGKFHGENFPYEIQVNKIGSSLKSNDTLRMKVGKMWRYALGVSLPNYRYDFYTNNFRKYINELSQPDELADTLTESLRFSTLTYGMNTLLRYADRNAMAHSVETRLPFLSHRLVEFIFSLPDHFKLNGGWTKYILRKSFENLLPEKICWRIDKIGYEPPQKKWLENKNIIEMCSEGFKTLVNRRIIKKSSNVNEWQNLMMYKLFNP